MADLPLTVVVVDPYTAALMLPHLPGLARRAAEHAARVPVARPHLPHVRRSLAAIEQLGRQYADYETAEVTDCGRADTAAADIGSGLREELTTAQAGAILDRHERTVRRRCERGEFGRLVGGRWLIYRDELMRVG